MQLFVYEEKVNFLPWMTGSPGYLRYSYIQSEKLIGGVGNLDCILNLIKPLYVRCPQRSLKSVDGDKNTHCLILSLWIL